MTLRYRGHTIETLIVAGHVRVFVKKEGFNVGALRSVLAARRLIDSLMR